MTPKHLFNLMVGIWAWLATIGYAMAGEGESQPDGGKTTPPGVEFLHTEVDAVGWAFDAIQQYPEQDRPFVRFIYLPAWADPEWLGIMDFAVNAACGQGATLVHGRDFAGGWLRGYDMRELAPKQKQTDKLLDVWDGLAEVESRFHVPKFNTNDKGHKYFLLAPHLQAALSQHVGEPKGKGVRMDEMVASFTQSSGAIYPADFMFEQLLTSVKGKYPEFRQIEFKSPDAKKTPLDFRLNQRGYFLRQTEKIGGDRSAFMLNSAITGKNRVVETAFGIGGGQPLLITWDQKDNRTDPAEQFARNPLNYQDFADANEIFAPLLSGLIEYLLTNNKGEFQRVAPPDVVADDNKPAGHTKELEMGMSCIICHAPGRGYLKVHNDFEKLVGSDTDFIGEVYLKGVKLEHSEAVDQFVAKFSLPLEQLDGILPRARNDFEKAVAQLIPTKPEAKVGPVEFLGLKGKEIYHQYRYKMIDRQQACLELGVRVPQDKAKKLFNYLVPAPKQGQNEDIVIALLRSGAEISRDQMDSVYTEMARRAFRNREGLIKSYNATRKQAALTGE